MMIQRPRGRRPVACIEVVELLTAHLDGQDVGIADHLAACEGCALALAQFREVVRVTATLVSGGPD